MASSKSSASAVSASLSGAPRRGLMANVRIEKEMDTKAENSVSLFGTQKKPIHPAVSFFNSNQVPEKSNFFSGRSNYYFEADRGNSNSNTGKGETKEKDLISWTEVSKPKAEASTAPKTTPSTGIETEAVHSAKPLIKREAKQEATTEPNPEVEEELSRVWESLKDKKGQDRITEWNYAVRKWCWLKYECE